MRWKMKSLAGELKTKKLCMTNTESGSSNDNCQKIFSLVAVLNDVDTNSLSNYKIFD